MTTVVNIRTSQYDVYIGRDKGAWPNTFGNPFEIGRDGTREDVIRKYKEWLTQDTRMLLAQKRFILNNLERLRGKRLGCFCKPKACHGDVLVELLEKTNG